MTDQQIKILLDLLENIEKNQNKLALDYNLFKQDIVALIKSIQFNNEVKQKDPKDYSSSFERINKNLLFAISQIETLKEKPKEEPMTFSELGYKIICSVLFISLVLGVFYHIKEIKKERDKKSQIVIDFVRHKNLGVDSIARYYGMTNDQIQYVRKNKK